MFKLSHPLINILLDVACDTPSFNYQIRFCVCYTFCVFVLVVVFVCCPFLVFFCACFASFRPVVCHLCSFHCRLCVVYHLFQTLFLSCFVLPVVLPSFVCGIICCPLVHMKISKYNQNGCEWIYSTERVQLILEWLSDLFAISINVHDATTSTTVTQILFRSVQSSAHRHCGLRDLHGHRPSKMADFSLVLLVFVLKIPQIFLKPQTSTGHGTSVASIWVHLTVRVSWYQCGEYMC